MEKRKIDQFVEDGLELELLDKLNSYVIQGFDNRAENLIKILIIVQEKSKIDWMQVNQALLKLIVKLLPEIVETSETLTRFKQIVKEGAEPSYERISFLIRQFLIGIQDKDPSLVSTEVSDGQLVLLQKNLLDLNVYFLEQGLNNKQDHNSIANLLYNCVERLGNERQVILNEPALDLFRNHITSYPRDYLSTFIRPYFSGTKKKYIDHFSHVPEPFYKQIFKPLIFPLDDFIKLARIRDISADLVTDIVEFDKRIKESDTAQRDSNVFLYSKEMETQAFRNVNGQINTDRFLKLKSSEHRAVRPECLPPAFMTNVD